MAQLGVTFLFLLIPLLADSFVPFEDCGSELYLESIQVSGCQTYPCHMKIGSAVQVTTNLLIQGKAVNSENLIHEVYLVVNHILTKVHVSPEPCKAFKSGIQRSTCNLETGERLTYETILDVSGVPPLPAKLYWTITDLATNRVIVCYKISVILTRVDT